MPVYTVKSQDCLTSIAARFGFHDYRTIYEHTENSEFRSVRPNPHVIQTGDRLFVPEASPRAKATKTGARHTLVVHLPPAEIRLHIKNSDGEPLANKDYILKVESRSDKPGTTDANGLIQEAVPAAAKRAQLVFESEGLSFNLNLGSMDPVQEPTGLASRLSNLGYACRPNSNAADSLDRIERALARLQADHGIEPTGQLDDTTLAVLKDSHDRGEES